jgi:serine/threonine protein kinase
MTPLSDATLDHLRGLGDSPALDATRYEMLGELGRGGMGAVYRVRDRELGREVALKVIGDAGGPDASQRLAREARALARLEHPGIVPVHDAGVLPDGRVYYTMKLVRGERLDQRLQRGLTLGESLRLFGRIAEAVAFAHANGVIHRDLKPQNVMLGAFGEVLVLDWGLAKLRAEPAGGSPAPPAIGTLPGRQTPAKPAANGSTAIDTQDGVVIGTPGFMAPEQASGDIRQIDERTDVYALGAILRSLTAAAGGRPSRPLTAIIGRATAAESALRYTSAAALAEDVARLQDGHPVHAYRENPLERLMRLARRHQVAVALVLAYLLMRVALLLITGR